MPRCAARRAPSRVASAEESRSGIEMPSTRSAPRARAHSAATTELSTPPERPTTAPRRFRVERTCSRIVCSMPTATAAASMFSTSRLPMARWLLPLQQLIEREPQEFAVGDAVALVEPPRFLREAEEPLEAHFLHPAGGAQPHACEHVEAAADADRQAHAQRVPLLLEETLLARHAHADEENVRARGAHTCGARGGFGRREVAVAIVDA